MVICCVPRCGTDSWKCDTSITFHDFPSSPDLAAKWIKQINSAIQMRPMWFPRGRPVICSKHFLHTDFRGDTDALKPRCVPTVFGHKYYGPNPEPHNIAKVNSPKKPPLIVKVIKPQETDNVSENAQTSCLQTDANFNTVSSTNGSIKVAAGSPIHKNYQTFYNRTSWNANHNQSNSLHNNTSRNNVLNVNVLKPNAINHRNIPKKNLKKRDIINSDLIEIGPNTFLKINPDVIKVNKKMTPSGNTVLQFLMDQKFAKSHGADVLPKLVQGVTPSSNDNTHDDVIAVETPDENSTNKKDKAPNSEKERVVHVLGHLVDNHKCEESCVDLREIVDETIDMGDSEISSEAKKKEDANSETSAGKETEHSNSTPDNINKPQEKNDDSSFIEKAPVLFKTNMPLSHCFIDKPKYLLQLKQKNRQIASLKFKISNLNKKIEELEDRCIVQERQLSYSFIKRLKTIRKNATKGDPSATYILEQIRSYSNNSKMRWSDSTLTQCAMWCRKAPYAYEYFKKAEFFKLPCLGTVKRYMKKHPELKFQKKTTKCGPQQEENEDESSSDFDFDESDGQNDPNALSEDEKDNESGIVKTALSGSQLPCPSDQAESATDVSEMHGSVNGKPTDGESEQKSNCESTVEEQGSVKRETEGDKNLESMECVDSNGIPITLDGANLELQEIILPSGEVVQCYSSNITNGSDIGSQYFIIPNVSDQGGNVDHEYSVVQTDSLPVILQNFDNSQLQLQHQDQLIFITNSSDQVECSETEVTSA